MCPVCAVKREQIDIKANDRASCPFESGNTVLSTALSCFRRSETGKWGGQRIWVNVNDQEIEDEAQNVKLIQITRIQTTKDSNGSNYVTKLTATEKQRQKIPEMSDLRVFEDIHNDSDCVIVPNGEA